MKKELTSGYQVATSESKNNAFTIGSQLTTAKGDTITINAIYTKPGACALYECVSETENLNGFSSSKELKTLCGIALESRSGATGGGRKAVSEAEIPTMYRQFKDELRVLKGKVLRLCEKYRCKENTELDKFTEIWKAEIAKQNALREQTSLQNKQLTAAKRYAESLGINASECKTLEAVNALINEHFKA